MTNCADGLRQLIEESGISLESDITRQLLVYLSLLEKWNSKVNLTSTTDWSGIGPLFQEAIWASRFFPDAATFHLDIGSGAGFPAIPLRILKPQIQLEMVESRVKRCVFLETLASSLGLAGTQVYNMRLNTFLRHTNSNKAWDCVSWKAIKLANDDLELLRKHSHPQTRFWMFHGRDPAVEAQAVFEKSFKLIRRERFQSDKFWFLSIYGPL
jgi:16S rRNA (guanine(527)-N(7))-methyltransferase RsmG